ncbi:MAG: hypothetical protein SGILL_006901 [Bacillariaceae sp.]
MKFTPAAIMTLASLVGGIHAGGSLRGAMEQEPSEAIPSSTGISTESLQDELMDQQLETQKDNSLWPQESSKIRIYRGFKHDWQRTVVGFRVPHRISLLESAVEDDSFLMGQSTGVDGNFQSPEGYYSTIESPQLITKEGSVHLTWDDRTSDGAYPQANTNKKMQFKVDITDVPSNDAEHAVFLQGIKINSSCEDAKQPDGKPCNSNGFWPWRMAFNIEECNVDESRNNMICDLDVEINRAWTPSKGGLPGIEEKPLNQVLSFDVDVNFGYISGPSDTFKATRGDPTVSRGAARQRAPVSGQRIIEGVANMPQGTIAMTGMEFSFKRTGTAANTNHLGRYINTLNFDVRDVGYDAATGSLNYRWSNQVGITDTVVATDVEYKISPLLLQFGHEDATVQSGRAVGPICVDSNGAPFFSVWRRCTRGSFVSPSLGPLQTRDSVQLN